MKRENFFTWKGLLLWSNHFYGIAAGLLCIETTLTLLKKPPSLFLIAFIYLSTVIYYTYAYLNESQAGIYNERSQWYLQNKKYLKIRQLVLILICFCIGIFHFDFVESFLSLTLMIKVILFITLFITLLYYYSRPIFKGMNIRNKGFLKSLSISWVWVFVCFIVPIVLESNGQFIFLDHYAFVYLLQLFIFILILAILFDIKDINRDNDENVKTLVSKYGIKPTIYKFIIPLVLLYIWVSLFLFFRLHQSFIYLVIPFLFSILILLVTYLIQKRKAIDENILLIDGMMVVKAMIGILLAYWI